MKTLALLLTLVLFSCASPNEPQNIVNDETGIMNPPSPGGTLEGIWVGDFQKTISQQGYYIPHYNIWCYTDLRVEGSRVWFTAYGAAYQTIFSGEISGDLLEGFQQQNNWSESQGVFKTRPIIPYTYTRLTQ